MRNHGATGPPDPAIEAHGPWTMGTFDRIGHNLRLSDVHNAYGGSLMSSSIRERLTSLLAHRFEDLSRWFLALAIRLGRSMTERRLKRGRIRTLWGTTPILTLPLKARCDLALGFKSESLVFTNYYISSDFTWNLKHAVRIFQRSPTAHKAFCRLILGMALIRYDIFHTFADRGILPSRGRFGLEDEEITALRAAGKRLYVFGYGADVRTVQRTLALGPWNFCRDCDSRGAYCICDDEIGARSIAKILRGATALVSCGDMLTYMPNAHNMAYWPIDTGRLTYTGVKTHAGALRIAHAPNHTHFKGTRYLEASIARLKERGMPIELVKLSGVPNSEVIKLFSEADIVADQFIGGSYGYAALEALGCGKPVLTYVRDRSLVTGFNDCPFINAIPDTLDVVLTWCVENRERLPAIGAQGRAYVERHHSISAVAARFAKLYINTATLTPRLARQLQDFIVRERDRSNAIQTQRDWQHPWPIPEVPPASPCVEGARPLA